MYLTQLYPNPRSYTETGGIYRFGTHVDMELSFSPCPETARRLVYLWQRFTCGCSTLTLIPGSGNGFTARNGKVEPDESVPAKDAYRIRIT